VLVPDKSPVKVQPEILDIFFLGEFHVVYMDGGGGHISLCVVNLTLTDVGPLAFILHFLNQYWIAVSQWLEHCPWLVLQYCR
jgi:hypothetical protein